MSVPAVQLGILSNLYLNTGSYASPTWVAVSLSSDFSMSIKADKGEASSRASRVKMNSKIMYDWAITAKLLASLTNTSYMTIMAALVSDTVLNFMALNGSSTTNGARGLMFDAQVFSGDDDLGLGAVDYTSIEIAPTYTGNSPNSVLVTSGAPVLTAV